MTFADLTSPAAALSLDAIRSCFEGAIPGVMATCAEDGMPNVAYISQVFHVDERHVALSFQFFNKTRQNILANPKGSVLVMNPSTAARYRLGLRYLRTETSGALFERMKAQLAGIASHSGMAAVFRLLGADVYEVEHIEQLPGARLPEPTPRVGLLAAVRRSAERLRDAVAADELFQVVLGVLSDHLGVPHAMVLMFDPETQRLYTVATSGYAHSGVGSEIEIGQGVVGVAARERTPVRISHVTSAAAYSHAVRSRLQETQPGLVLDTEIAYPGLEKPHSQLAVPVISSGRLLGAIFVESEQDMCFGFDEEDALVAIAGQFGAMLELLQRTEEAAAATLRDEIAMEDDRRREASALAGPVAGTERPADEPPMRVRHYLFNHSVFVDDRYLIKGVAGAILRKLLEAYVQTRRTEFTNRELRLDPTLGLPHVADNLEARLVLLQRRLAENGPGLRIERTGRGRFVLRVQRPLLFEEIAS